MHTLKASIDIADMAVHRDLELRREINERRALARVRSTEADDSDLGQSSRILLEHGVDECGRTDANTGHLGRGDLCTFEQLTDSPLDTVRDIWGRGSFEMREDATVWL